MDINFIIFFIFLLIIIEYISCLEDGMMLIIVSLFMAAIFANTQSLSPIFFSDSAYLGFGSLFNTFWLMLCIICLVKSFFIAKSQGLLKGVK